MTSWGREPGYLEEGGVHVLDAEGAIGDEDARRELVDGLVELAQHVLGLAPQGDVPDHADRAHKGVLARTRGVFARGCHLAVGDDGDDHVAAAAGARLALEADLEVLRTAIDAPPLVEELGAERRAGRHAAKGLEHRIAVHRLCVLVVKEYREVLAKEIGGLVAEEPHGIVDEGKAPRGVELVDDVGQGVHEVLVSPLEGREPPAEALTEGDEYAKIDRRAGSPAFLPANDVVEGVGLDDLVRFLAPLGGDEDDDRIRQGRGREGSARAFPALGVYEEETLRAAFLRNGQRLCERRGGGTRDRSFDDGHGDALGLEGIDRLDPLTL